MTKESNTEISEKPLKPEQLPFDATLKPVVIAIAFGFVILELWYWWGNYYVLELAQKWRGKLPPEVPTAAVALAELGQVGDLFGGINALFASLAFIGVGFAAYYQRSTFLLQLKDSQESAKAFQASLAQQKIDTEENRIAIKEAKEANETQSNNAKKELFNSFFFRMLTEVDSTMKNVKMTPASLFGKWRLYQPDDKFDDESFFFNEIMEHIDSELNGVWHQIYYTDQRKKQYGPQPKDVNIGFVARYHEKIYKPNRRTLAPFLRNFFHTFTIIKEQQLTYSEQCKYSKIARASINELILILVMLNGLSSEGKNLRPILEEYGLLKHLSADGNTKHARMIAEYFYHPTAFLGYGKRSQYYSLET